MKKQSDLTLEQAWGPMLHTAAFLKLKTDLKLKTGDVIPRGTKVQVKFLGMRETRVCDVFFDWVGDSGRDYNKVPAKLAVSRLSDFLTGFRRPSMTALRRMSENGIATTPTGKRVEPDGVGPDGSPSWLLVLGYI